MLRANSTLWVMGGMCGIVGTALTIRSRDCPNDPCGHPSPEAVTPRLTVDDEDDSEDEDSEDPEPRRSKRALKPWPKSDASNFGHAVQMWRPNLGRKMLETFRTKA